MLENYFDKIKSYFWFTKDEFKGFVVTVFVLAFIFSFSDWGVQAFDAVVGLQNFAVAFMVVLVSVFVHHSAQRLAALVWGFRAEHILWWQGLTFSALIALFTNGALKLLPGSALMIHHMPVHRLGFYRYGPNFQTFGKIAVFGPLANLVFAVLVRIVGELFVLNVSKLYFFNLLFAAYNLLPFPPLDGSRIFYASRLLYVFVFSAIVGYVVLALVAGFQSIILALIIGAVGWFLFYVFFEKGWS